ncbi:hypothetical protein OIA45_41120 (plasmid) [Streptomyces chartreusis]|uniref:hypothetical protein n=1 Tax=Streptomyces chartreusis TaxID=1969 RepID=UPI002F91702C|nr:hypothetical protein OIA45_41120 [Streptomyces chartreusis]
MHDETWAAAVRYAVDQGTDVINMSFGNDGGKTLSEGGDRVRASPRRRGGGRGR